MRREKDVGILAKLALSLARGAKSPTHKEADGTLCIERLIPVHVFLVFSLVKGHQLALHNGSLDDIMTVILLSLIDALRDKCAAVNGRGIGFLRLFG